MSRNDLRLPFEMWSELFFQGVEDVLGTQALAGLMRAPGEQGTASLLLSLPQQYGERTAQGIAVRAGRAALRHLLRRRADALGLGAMEFWLLPPRRRLSQGLRALMDGWENAPAHWLALGEDEHTWQVQIRGGLFASADPAHLGCWFLSGLLQEFLSWAGGARVYPLRALTCTSSPEGACQMVLAREPLD